MKKAFIVATISAVALMGCSKDEQKIQGNNDESVTSFRDINVPGGFDFSNTKTVIVSLTEEPKHSPITSRLIAIENADGQTLLKYIADLSQGFELPIELPTATKEVFLVDADGNKKSIKIASNQLIIDLNSY